MNTKTKTVAALDKVMQICNTHGARYNPSNAALQSTAIATLLEQAQERMKAVSVAEAALINASNARIKGVAEIKKVAIQVTRLVETLNVSKEEIDDAKMIKRRLLNQSRPVKVNPGGDASAIPVKTGRPAVIHTPQKIAEMFRSLVDVVQGISGYGSNDPGLTIEGLKSKLAELEALNLAVMQAKTNLGAARRERDNLLEGQGGVIEITRKAKNFIRSKFGVFSLESKETKESKV